MAERQFRDGIAIAIGALRAERRWTQRELCRRTELSPAYLSELESAQKDASADVLDRLAAAFGIGMDEFLWVSLLGMMIGEAPGVQRRNAALELARHVLQTNVESRRQIEEFVQFQKWRNAGGMDDKAVRGRMKEAPASDESEGTEPDFTED